MKAKEWVAKLQSVPESEQPVEERFSDFFKGYGEETTVNGSLNIGRKVIGDKVYETFSDRSIAAMPVRINPLVTRCV